MKRSIITTFLAGTPSSTYSVATGYSVGSEWINTNNGNRFYHKTDGNWVILGADSPFYIQGGTSSAFDTTSSVYRTGNIGIGTASPSTKLHIYATQSGAFRLVDGTEGNGYILTSDINGVASWTASVSGGGISGTGTTNYLPKFTGSTSLGNSTITDTGSIVNINSKLIIDTSLGVYTTKTGWDTFSTGFGYQALNNSTGERNTAFGYRASSENTTGGYNCSFGQFALFSSTQSMENTAVGAGSLAWLTTGDRNIGIGRNAGVGAGTSLVNMSDSIFIGYLTTPANNGETNQIVIGNSQAGNGSNSVTLGNSSITKTILRGNIGLGTASPSTKLHIFATQSGAFRLVDTTQGPGYVLTSDANGVASWTSSLTGLSLLGNSEVISASVSATASLVVYDYSSSSIFYHATASTNFTANFTNLPTTNNRVLSATIVISQGATAYIPNIVQIAGVTQSIKWAGGTQSGTTNSLDLISFNFIRTGNVWTSVIGQIAPFS